MTAPDVRSITHGRCAIDGCTVAEGGPCTRDFKDPFDCEDFEPDEGDVNNEEDVPSELQDADSRASEPILDARGRTPWRDTGTTELLHSGEALTAIEATRIMQQHSANVVVPIGSAGVGKTTLLTALYETLGKAPLGEWTFAGSLSLLGFEARSFLATRASGRTVADTPRTSRSSDKLLLHLAIRDATGIIRHLLIADVSGEHAESMRMYNDPGDYESLLRSATCVLLMVDGERLADDVQRHAVESEVRTAFRVTRENGLLADGVAVHVVATKWDLCGSPEADRILASIGAEISGAGIKSDILRIAARPVIAGNGGGDEFTHLLGMMLLQRTKRAFQPPSVSSRLRAAHLYEPGAEIAKRLMKAAR